jgi:hypothetical protein
MEGRKCQECPRKGEQTVLILVSESGRRLFNVDGNEYQ